MSSSSFNREIDEHVQKELQVIQSGSIQELKDYILTTYEYDGVAGLFNSRMGNKHSVQPLLARLSRDPADVAALFPTWETLKVFADQTTGDRKWSRVEARQLVSQVLANPNEFARLADTPANFVDIAWSKHGDDANRFSDILNLLFKKNHNQKPLIIDLAKKQSSQIPLGAIQLLRDLFQLGTSYAKTDLMVERQSQLINTVETIINDPELSKTLLGDISKPATQKRFLELADREFFGPGRHGNFTTQPAHILDQWQMALYKVLDPTYREERKADNVAEIEIPLIPSAPKQAPESPSSSNTSEHESALLLEPELPLSETTPSPIRASVSENLSAEAIEVKAGSSLNPILTEAFVGRLTEQTSYIKNQLMNLIEGFSEGQRKYNSNQLTENKISVFVKALAYYDRLIAELQNDIPQSNNKVFYDFSMSAIKTNKHFTTTDDLTFKNAAEEFRTNNSFQNNLSEIKDVLRNQQSESLPAISDKLKSLNTHFVKKIFDPGTVKTLAKNRSWLTNITKAVIAVASLGIVPLLYSLSKTSFWATASSKAVAAIESDAAKDIPGVKPKK